LAADSIYATNYNRSYCSKRNITTSFVRKGRAGYYGLDKICARTKSTEILWIFFGIDTANAVRMIAKAEKFRDKQAA
jgi:hypothetical protein